MKPYFVSTLGFIFLLHLFGSFQSVNGATKKPYLTKEEHMRFSKFLKDELKKKYPSDAEDDGEIVIQEKQGSTTVYKLAKEQEDCPDTTNVIFRSAGKKEVGKDVVVLMRGQDYFNPTNKERFVVLRQKGGGSEYSTHLATVKRDSKNKLKVNWDTVAITLTKDASPLIELSTKPILVVGKFGTRKVPRCAWTGDVLLCEARKEPRKIGEKRPKKPKRRRPKPAYGKLPTPMPPFPPPPKKVGHRKIKNPFGIGEEGGPPLVGLPGLDKPLIDPIPGLGLPVQGPGQGQNKPQVYPAPGQDKPLIDPIPGLGLPVQGPGQGQNKPQVYPAPGQDKPLIDPIPGLGLPVQGPGKGPGQGQNNPQVYPAPGTKPGENKPKPGAGGKESSEETFVMHKGKKPPGTLQKEKKKGK